MMTSQTPPVRWGFVGTGRIANAMAEILRQTDAGVLAACASRTQERADEFMNQHGAERGFDSWQEMIEWDGVDAIYLANPTSERESVGLAAAKAGKHVLGEKPFASAPSLKRIVAACKENNVGFMDGTHFTHHPRTLELQSKLDEIIGKRRVQHTVLQFKIHDKTNIRMLPDLEPMGAIGDVGWYNMRAIVEYINEDAQIKSLESYIRRDDDTNAVVGCTGVITFDNESTVSWRCGFDAGDSRGDMSLDGAVGGVFLKDFHIAKDKGSAQYRYRSNNPDNRVDEVNTVDAPVEAAALMFQAFAAQIADASLRDQWAKKTIRTQTLLDAIWERALQNEQA